MDYFRVLVIGAAGVVEAAIGALLKPIVPMCEFVAKKWHNNDPYWWERKEHSKNGTLPKFEAYLARKKELELAESQKPKPHKPN